MPWISRVIKTLCFAVVLTGLTMSTGDAVADDSAPAAERIAVGHQAPDFTLESSAGDTYNLSELRGEKNVLLIFFRGTW